MIYAALRTLRIVEWRTQDLRVCCQIPEINLMFSFIFSVIRLELNCDHVDYYTELDSVLLIGSVEPPISMSSSVSEEDFGTNVDTGEIDDGGDAPWCVCGKCICCKVNSNSNRCTGSLGGCSCECNKDSSVDATDYISSLPGSQILLSREEGGSKTIQNGDSSSKTDQPLPVADSISNSLAKLHMQDGLSAVSGFEDNGYFDEIPVSSNFASKGS